MHAFVMLGCGAKAINDTMYTTIVIVTLWAILRSKQGLLRRLGSNIHIRDRNYDIHEINNKIINCTHFIWLICIHAPKRLKSPCFDLKIAQRVTITIVVYIVSLIAFAPQPSMTQHASSIVMRVIMTMHAMSST